MNYLSFQASQSSTVRIYLMQLYKTYTRKYTAEEIKKKQILMGTSLLLQWNNISFCGVCLGWTESISLVYDLDVLKFNCCLVLPILSKETLLNIVKLKFWVFPISNILGDGIQFANGNCRTLTFSALSVSISLLCQQRGINDLLKLICVACFRSKLKRPLEFVSQPAQMAQN